MKQSISCPKCYGTGTVYEMGLVYGESDCNICKGGGVVTMLEWIKWLLGIKQ